jgi:hypothetical protein
MSEAERLRDRATRLFALALKARERGPHDDAEELERLAAETLAQAEDMERRPVPPPADAHQQPARQQQQPQPEPKE